MNKRILLIVDGEVIMSTPLSPAIIFADGEAEAIMASNPIVMITGEDISAGHLWDGQTFTLPMV